MQILKKIFCFFIRFFTLFFSKLYAICRKIFACCRNSFRFFQTDSFQDITQSSYDVSLESEADLQDAINQSAGHLRGLWIGYISLAAYLVITALTVTHRNLFLGLPIKLPILDIELSLYAFFIASPIVFVGLYLYFIFHLRILYAQVVKYQKICSGKVSEVEFKKRFLFDPFVFIQYWVGHARDRKSRIMFWLIDFCSVKFLPFIALFLFLLCLLPYHDSLITYFHRIMILITLMLVFIFKIPSTAHFSKTLRRKTINILSPICVFVVMIGFVFGVMVFPGEELYDKRPEFLKTATHFLLESSVDNTTGEATKFFTNHLVLANEDFVDDDVLEKMDKRDNASAGSKSREVINRFGGRHLENAVFDYADLRRSSFTGAYIAGASFMSARLSKSDFDCGALTILKREDCNVQNPNVNFSYAQMMEVDFTNAQLPNANFYQTHLHEANFYQTQLQNAHLGNAFLYSTSLHRSNLQGADLFFAFLHGTDLTDSQLQGVDLRNAQLKAVNLTQTGLQGADFTRANLQGVNFKQAGLQGTNFDCATFKKTYIPNVNIWNSNIAYYSGDDPRQYLCPVAREFDMYVSDNDDDNQIVQMKEALYQKLLEEKATCTEDGCQETAQKQFDILEKAMQISDSGTLKKRDDKEGWIKNLLIAKNYKLKECLEDKQCKEKVEIWFKNIVEPDTQQIQKRWDEWVFVDKQYAAKDKDVFLNDFWKYRATLVCQGDVYMQTMMGQIDDFKEYKPVFAQSFFELENKKKCRNINPSVTPKQRLTLEDWADI